MKRIISFLEKIPLFLFLIPLFLVIHIEREFQGLVTYEFVYREIVELLIAPLVILLVCYLLFRNRRKALFGSIPFMIIFYFFADLKDFMTDKFPDTLVSSYSFLLPMVGICCISVYILVRKNQTKFRLAFLYTNLLFLLFILADLLLIWLGGNIKPGININAANSKQCTDCPRPDIFHIVFDSYTSTTRLKSEFGFDNSRIDSFLSKKKFYIVRHAKSNYNFTIYSIGSTFNTDYLAGLDTAKKLYLRDYLPYLGLIRENMIVQTLSSKGYEIINHSIFNFKEFPSTIPSSGLWNINILYKRHNIFKKIDMEIGWWLRSKINKTGNIYLSEKYIIARDKHDSLSIAAVKQTLDKPGASPRFVYTHIEIPHAPFSFDSTGKRFRVPVVLSPEKDKSAYISHLIYSNTKLVDLINTIFAKAKRPFIIVLQGDHGFRYFNREKKEMEFDNLSAFYFYNQDYRQLYDSMSNVNTYNVILNTFFGANLPMKKDSTIFMPY